MRVAEGDRSVVRNVARVFDLGDQADMGFILARIKSARNEERLHISDYVVSYNVQKVW